MEFGDCFFRQLTGTAMGTSAAVMWAIIYFYLHEKRPILPRYETMMPMFMRYIDEIFALVLIEGSKGPDARKWNTFKCDLNNFGLLKWNVDEPSLDVTFLGPSVSIEQQILVTRTY